MKGGRVCASDQEPGLAKRKLGAVAISSYMRGVSDYHVLHLVFAAFVALFPPVNPIGTALIAEPFLHTLSPEARKRAARKIAIYCLGICVAALLVGAWIFKLFGISIPVVQVAGGLMICRMGWGLLDSEDTGDSGQSAAPTADEKVDDLLFYPLAFPMTTGAGTISVLLTLSAHSHSSDTVSFLTNQAAILGAVILMCILIYLSYAFAPWLLRRLGKQGGTVVNRLGAFLVFCVGLQIAVSGALALFPRP